MTCARPAAGLILVATPIGNIGDVSRRALAALAEADIVLCEDTRVTRRLLSAHGIRTPLMSYHDHNGHRVRPRVLERLRKGERVVLVSDAGTPTIADSGFRLVDACHAEEIAVSTVPGPTALIAALSISGLPTDRFYFGGFLPPKPGPRRAALKAAKSIDATLIHYESTRRLADSLADAAEIFPGRQAAVGRELTKLHEEVRRGSTEALARYFSAADALKGEAVLLIGPPTEADGEDHDLIDAALREALTECSLKDAVHEVVRSTGAGRNRVYRRALALAGNREETC